MTYPGPFNLEKSLNWINSLLEVLKKVEWLVEQTLELQEGEKQKIINQFREKIINRTLRKIKEINNNLTSNE